MNSYDEALAKTIKTGKPPKPKPHKFCIHFDADMWEAIQLQCIKYKESTIAGFIKRIIGEKLNEQGTLKNISTPK